MEQAKRDTKAGQLPAVFHRKNNRKWKVTMELDIWIKIYSEFYSSNKLKDHFPDITKMVKKESEEKL